MVTYIFLISYVVSVPYIVPDTYCPFPVKSQLLFKTYWSLINFVIMTASQVKLVETESQN